MKSYLRKPKRGKRAYSGKSHSIIEIYYVTIRICGVLKISKEYKEKRTFLPYWYANFSYGALSTELIRSVQFSEQLP